MTEVTPGSVWQVGNHLFHTGDLMNGTTPDFEFDIVYADPPWNGTQLHRFRRVANVDPPDHKVIDIYRRIVDLADGKPLYLECGVQLAPKLLDILPGPHTAEWDITYYRKLPAKVVYTGPTRTTADLTGLDEERDTILTALRAHPRGVVLDPVAGTGLTAAAANFVGWHSINNELNPARTLKALNRLALITGKEPRRIV